MTEAGTITHWLEQEPEAPFYAVIFISRKSANNEAYQEMDEHLMSEVRGQPGFLGYSSQGTDGAGIFISYWKDEDSIDNWRKHGDHLQAKRMASERWYDYFHSMICRVKSSHVFIRETADKL